MAEYIEISTSMLNSYDLWRIGPKHFVLWMEAAMECGTRRSVVPNWDMVRRKMKLQRRTLEKRRAVLIENKLVSAAEPYPLMQVGTLWRPGRDRPPINEWAHIRLRIFERDDYTCRYCGERGGKLECDHVVPVAKGGSHEDDNLVTACFGCNRSKRDKTVEEWKAI